ncbi:MAG: hypothetical protein HGA22_08410 [Clostridiales bacterium]|nr:hypothetical protein [Clostridiales bacterium]
MVLPEGWSVKGLAAADESLAAGETLAYPIRIFVSGNAKKGVNQGSISICFNYEERDDCIGHIEPDLLSGKARSAFIGGVSAELLFRVPVSSIEKNCYLSDIECEYSDGDVHKDKVTMSGPPGGPAGPTSKICLGGRTFDKGLSMNAPAAVTFYTGGLVTGLNAEVGVDDSSIMCGEAAFRVIADGKEVFDRTLVVGGGSEKLNLDLSGVMVLRLELGKVTSAGFASASGVWAEAIFTINEPEAPI